MRSLPRVIPVLRVLTIGLTSMTALTGLSAQATVHHPTITGVSPRNPTPGQTVTISGTDLKVPTWTIKLQYMDKYSGTFHELTLSGTNTALTFSAPSSLRPDSIAVQYSNDVRTDALNNPIPQDEQRPLLPTIHVQHVPVLRDTIGTFVMGVGGVPFQVIRPGSITITGKDLLKIPPLSSTFSTGITRTILDADLLVFRNVSPSNAPTVRFAGSALIVSSARYVPKVRDEVTFGLGAFTPNATGYLSVTTPIGADSVLVSIAQAPQNARVVDIANNNAFTVTTGQLIRGRRYEIHGQNLSLRQSIADRNNLSAPSVTLGGAPLTVVVASNGGLADTLVQFTIAASSGPPSASAPLVLTHAGGSVTIGNFSAITQPVALNVSGAAITPSDIIGGTSATLTVSFSPTPTNFSTAGSLVVTVPSTLTSVIPQPAPFPITSNPLIISIPTNATTTALTGNLNLGHSSGGAVGAFVNVTVRPPRPVALTVTGDSIAGSTSMTGRVAFDQEGPATVFLSSSDPSVLTVPASVARSGTFASFTISTQSVATPHPVTVTAALNGVTTTHNVVVLPGRVASLTVSPSTITAGENLTATVAFTVPVTGFPVTITSSDTAIHTSTFATNVSGASHPFTLSSTNTLATAVAVTLTATSDGISRSAVVQVNPMQLSQFTVAPASAVGGTTLAATLRLGRAAIRPHVLRLTSSDTTVATVSAVQVFNVGEDVKVVNVTLRGPQTAARTAIITASLLARDNVNAAVISTKSITVTATP